MYCFYMVKQKAFIIRFKKIKDLPSFGTFEVVKASNQRIAREKFLRSSIKGKFVKRKGITSIKQIK